MQKKHLIKQLAKGIPTLVGVLFSMFLVMSPGIGQPPFSEGKTATSASTEDRNMVADLMPLPSLPAHANPDTYHVVIIRVLYSDTTSTPYTLDQLKLAAKEIENFFDWLSYGKLDMQVSVVEVKLKNTQQYYSDLWSQSKGHILMEDAAEAAAEDGFDFTGIDGISILSPFCGVDITFSPHTISRPGVNGTFQQAYDFECTNSFPQQPSGVFWGAWAHEIGHQLQSKYGLAFGHPSNYASGYDLMDSCYPCHDSAYSLSGTFLSNWLPGSKVVTVDKPSSGTTGVTVVLAPLEQDPTTTTAAQAIKVPVAAGKYYVVEARRRLKADSLQNGSLGIWDEGVHILEVEESRTPPVKLIDFCDYTGVPGGCIRQCDPNKPNYDSRCPNCGTAKGGGVPTKADDVPAYCWPYPLWHVGNAFNDSANAIQISVVAVVGDGYAVTVTRGVPPGHPDVFIVPWLTPPMNTWETIDIWLDSSCNGYESDLGPGTGKGLKYGRRADGTVIGNGDDPCANHENRIYARVRNGGDAPANNVVVRFKVSDPLGVGVTGTWKVVGTATSSEFPALVSLAPGDSTVVYVPWTPTVSLTLEQINQGHFKFHSCVQVIIDPVAGELVTSNQDGEGEQENFGYFEAVMDPQSGAYSISGPEGPQGSFYIHNTFDPADIKPLPRTFFLDVRSELPSDWSYLVADGETALTLAPGEMRKVPVNIKVPPKTPIGQTYLLKVRALTKVTLHNDAIPPVWTHPARVHEHLEVIAGVVLAAQTVLKANLSLVANLDSVGNIVVSGHLDPAHADVMIAVDYTDPSGNVKIRLVSTDGTGNYKDTFAPSVTGLWTVRAIWQGDLDHSSAVSDAVPVRVGRVPRSLYVSSWGTNQVKRYDGTTGTFISNFASGGGLGLPVGLAFGSDGNLYVSSPTSNNVLRYNGTTGAFMNVFASGGGLSNPQGLVFGPDVNLYVSSFNTHSILRYNGMTGAFMGTFASFPGNAAVNCGPEGLVFGPDGNLYVSCSLNSSVARFNGATGAFMGFFVERGSGRLSNPQGLTFGPDGNLYVSSFNTHEVKRYSGGTGAFINNFVLAFVSGLVNPNGLVFDPDGNLYVSSFGTNTVKRYNGATGVFMSNFASGGGLVRPTFLIFK